MVGPGALLTEFSIHHRLCDVFINHLKNDSIDLAEVPEILLLEVRVALVLEDCWLVLGPRDVEDLLDLPLVEVGEANGLDQPLVHQFLHLKPGLNVVGTVVSAVVALVVKGEKSSYSR